MNLIKDLLSHLKEWSDWQLKDWIKAGIVAVVVLFIIYKMTGGGAQMLQLLLKPLLGVAGQAVSGFVETKKAKAQLKLTEVQAATI